MGAVKAVCMTHAQAIQWQKTPIPIVACPEPKKHVSPAGGESHTHRQQAVSHTRIASRR